MNDDFFLSNVPGRVITVDELIGFVADFAFEFGRATAEAGAPQAGFGAVEFEGPLIRLGVGAKTMDGFRGWANIPVTQKVAKRGNPRTIRALAEIATAELMADFSEWQDQKLHERARTLDTYVADLSDAE